MSNYRQDYKGGAYTHPYHPEYCGHVWQPEHPALGNLWVEPYTKLDEAKAFLDGVEAALKAMEVES